MEKNLQTILNDYDYVDFYDISDLIVTGLSNDQSHYQVWDYESGMDIIEFYIEFVGKEAGNSNVFGYYTDGDTSTFTPIFQVPGSGGMHDGYLDVPVLLPTESLSNILVPSGPGGELAFAICSDDDPESGVGSNQTFYSKTSDNVDGMDHSLVFDLCNDTYVICFEDLNATVTDGDYEDVVVIMKVTDCFAYLDFGDAPDPTYPTLLASNGARHRIGGPWLGDLTDMPDAEADGQPDPNALGDDMDIFYPPVNDDEDGATIPPLEIGQINTIILEVNESSGAGGWVDAWIDYDQDGTWQHPGELIYSGFLPVGTHAIGISVPSGLSVGTTFARFRINSQGPLPPDGYAEDGEVEDHEVILQDTIPPVQTIQFGNPKNPNAYPGGLWRIGANTKIWVNSTDSGVGTERMRIEVWWDSTHTGPGDYDTNLENFLVYDDNGSGGYTGRDTDPTPGRISVILFMDISCYHEIDAWCYDYEDNMNFVKSDFLVDADGPIVEKVIGFPQYGDFVNFSTTINLTATDQIVGDINCSTQCIQTIYWTITVSGGEPMSYYHDGNTTEFTFDEECNHTLEFWAVDCLGNEGPHTTQTHYVDDTPPTTVKEYGTPKCGCEPPYITSQTPIYLNATDGGLCKAGGVTIYYRVWFDGTWTTWMDSATNVTLTMEQLGLPWDDDCIHYIEYYAADCLGNTEELHNQTFYVDNTGPTVAKDIGEPQHNNANGNFIRIFTPIWLNATDPSPCASGATKVVYKINGGDEVVTMGDTVKFNFTENCTHILEFWAEDCLGNEGSHTVQTHYVDEEAPVLSHEYIPAEFKKDGRYWISNTTIKRVIATDKGCGVGGAGVEKIEWMVQNETASPPTISENTTWDNKNCYYEDEHVIVTGDNDPTVGIVSIDILIKESCNHSIRHKAIDYLDNGNTTLWGLKQNVKVDNKPPIVTKIVGEPSWPGEEHGDYYVTNQTRIYINATDDDSTYPCNVSSVHLKVGIWYDGIWNYTWYNVSSGSINVSFTFEEAGVGDECIHYVTYWAEDDVGNSIVEDNETFFVDNTPPQSTKQVGQPQYTENLPVGVDYYVTRDTPIWINVTDDGTDPCIVVLLVQYISTIEYGTMVNGAMSIICMSLLEPSVKD